MPAQALTNELIHSLPKVELHCHLDGSVPLAAYRAMAKLRGNVVPADEAKLLGLVQGPPQCKDLTEYLTYFGLAGQALSYLDLLRLATGGLVQALAAENVVYAELRFAPQFLQGQGATQRQVVQTVADELARAGREHGVKAQAILCMMRHLPREENLPMLDLAEEFRGQGVCAVDLAGDEAAWPAQLYADLFSEAARRGLQYTIHAGEQGSADNVRRSVAMGTRRIGHGIAARTDPALMAELAAQGVLLEMCPVSNLQTSAVPSWADYPFQRFIDEGLNISINTDNRTVSATSLSREFSELAQHFPALDAACMHRLTQNAIRGAFVEEAQRAALLERIDAGYAPHIA